MMDPETQAILKSNGYDVEFLQEKYAKRSKKCTKPSRGDNVPSNEKGAKDLNDLFVCKSCHGFGLIKYSYNHIVCETNCDVCEGEGILRMDSVKGQLSPIVRGEKEKDT